jgi:hypothetical protein
MRMTGVSPILSPIHDLPRSNSPLPVLVLSSKVRFGFKNSYVYRKDGKGRGMGSRKKTGEESPLPHHTLSPAGRAVMDSGEAGSRNIPPLPPNSHRDSPIIVRRYYHRVMGHRESEWKSHSPVLPVVIGESTERSNLSVVNMTYEMMGKPMQRLRLRLLPLRKQRSRLESERKRRRDVEISAEEGSESDSEKIPTSQLFPPPQLQRKVVFSKVVN